MPSVAGSYRWQAALFTCGQGTIAVKGLVWSTEGVRLRRDGAQCGDAYPSKHEGNIIGPRVRSAFSSRDPGFDPGTFWFGRANCAATATRPQFEGMRGRVGCVIELLSHVFHLQRGQCAAHENFFRPCRAGGGSPDVRVLKMLQFYGEVKCG